PAVADQQTTADQNSDPANRPAGDFRGYSQSARTAFATVRNLLSTLQASRAAAGEPATGMSPADARPLSPGELYRDLQELQLQVVGDENDTASLKERALGQVREYREDASLNEEQEESRGVGDRLLQSGLSSPNF